MAGAGETTDVFLPTDRATGKPRGFAFVEFVSHEAVLKAIADFDEYDFKGRNLRVNEAESRPPRPGGFRGAGAPSGGGGGGGFNDDDNDRGGGGGGFGAGKPPGKPKGSRRNKRAKFRSL